MPLESRRQQRQHWTLEVRMDNAENDLDELEEEGRVRSARITQLMVIAATLLVSVSTAVILMFVTGVVGK